MFLVVSVLWAGLEADFRDPVFSAVVIGAGVFAIGGFAGAIVGVDVFVPRAGLFAALSVAVGVSISGILRPGDHRWGGGVHVLGAGAGVFAAGADVFVSVDGVI